MLPRPRRASGRVSAPTGSERSKGPDYLSQRVTPPRASQVRCHLSLQQSPCEALSITPKRTRPYRPQTNGKVERFHRTMADGWAYARCYTSEQERRDALPDWLHQYNQHRPHTACDNQPPFSRLTNVPGHYN